MSVYQTRKPSTTVLVCGSRTWEDRAAIERELSCFFPDETLIITGTRSRRTPVERGADQLTVEIAEALGFTVEVIEADWRRLGRRAGPIRNRQMLDRKPDLVLAFWDGQSPGTKDAITEARRRGVTVEIVGPQ